MVQEFSQLAAQSAFLLSPHLVFIQRLSIHRASQRSPDDFPEFPCQTSQIWENLGELSLVTGWRAPGWTDSWLHLALQCIPYGKMQMPPEDFRFPLWLTENNQYFPTHLQILCFVSFSSRLVDTVHRDNGFELCWLRAPSVCHLRWNEKHLFPSAVSSIN